MIATSARANLRQQCNCRLQLVAIWSMMQTHMIDLDTGWDRFTSIGPNIGS
jgi:hypothetical protein